MLNMNPVARLLPLYELRLGHGRFQPETSPRVDEVVFVAGQDDDFRYRPRDASQSVGYDAVRQCGGHLGEDAGHGLGTLKEHAVAVFLGALRGVLRVRREREGTYLAVGFTVCTALWVGWVLLV